MHLRSIHLLHAATLPVDLFSSTCAGRRSSSCCHFLLDSTDSLFLVRGVFFWWRFCWPGATSAGVVPHPSASPSASADASSPFNAVGGDDYSSCDRLESKNADPKSWPEEDSTCASDSASTTVVSKALRNLKVEQVGSVDERFQHLRL